MNPDYIDNPNFCPQCGSKDITGHQFDVENRLAWQAVTCVDCLAEWHDLFTLTGYELVVEARA